MSISSILASVSRNEVLAREGIDTISAFHGPAGRIRRRNEVLAREGIDTSIDSSSETEYCSP